MCLFYLDRLLVVNEKKPHIIGITETWCNQSILDSEVAIEDYSMFRLDKGTVTGTGGGVILYRGGGRSLCAIY